jgi:starch synthase
VLTIHNLQHQGLLDRRILGYLGLPEWLFQPQELECLGGVNFLKGGILHATRVATVSPTYAREILTPEYGYGLDDVVRRRQGDLEGILNGVDTDDWDPRRDPHLARNFSAQDLTGKAACKAALQSELKLDESPDMPLVGVISRLWDQKGLDLAVRALPRFLRAGQIQLALLGSGDAALENEYRRLADVFPGRCAVKIGYDHGLSHRIEAGADFFLMPSRFEPCGLNQLYSMTYGTLPIVRATGGLADTVKPWSPSARQGTGIVFHHADVAAIEWALEQAVTLYARPADFATAQQQAMREEFSWGKAAQAYVACYQKAIRRKQS